MSRLGLSLFVAVWFVGCSQPAEEVDEDRRECTTRCNSSCLSGAEVSQCERQCQAASRPTVVSFNQCARTATGCGETGACLSNTFGITITENNGTVNNGATNNGTANNGVATNNGSTNANNGSTNNQTTSTNNMTTEQCFAPDKVCNGNCTSLQFNPDHCGACGVQCSSGFCYDGICGCTGNADCGPDEVCDFQDGNFVCVEGPRGDRAFGEACGDAPFNPCADGLCLNTCTTTCETVLDCPQGYDCINDLCQ